MHEVLASVRRQAFSEPVRHGTRLVQLSRMTALQTALWSLIPYELLQAGIVLVNSPEVPQPVGPEAFNRT